MSMKKSAICIRIQRTVELPKSISLRVLCRTTRDLYVPFLGQYIALQVQQRMPISLSCTY